MNSQKIGQLETSIVNSTNRRLHDDVYELHLESGKVLKPTGNHPLFTDKGWTTIDGHSPNHAGGSGYLKVGDKVFDINNNWVSVIDIVRVDGEYETFIGVTHEYEVSDTPELILNTGTQSIEECSEILYEQAKIFFNI